jgi:uncharacterized membrane protein
MKIAKNFFTKQEQELLVNSISTAELKTSGEIRLHIDNICLGDVIKRTEKVFTKLNMHQTAERNGVLIYLSILDKKIAVVGDIGIHQKLGAEFWNETVNELIEKFKTGNKALALADCILHCGNQLGKYFPRKTDDKNELNNNLSF